METPGERHPDPSTQVAPPTSSACSLIAWPLDRCALSPARNLTNAKLSQAKLIDAKLIGWWLTDHATLTPKNLVWYFAVCGSVGCYYLWSW